ncbi:3217_t:CDS:2, partial [Racocetra fulgida]
VEGVKDLLKGTFVHSVEDMDLTVSLSRVEDAGEGLDGASINFHEPSLINQGTTTTHLGTSHTYNNIATIPSFGTTDVFIDQGQTLNDQNTVLINPCDAFFETTGTLIDHEPTPNHSYIYNHITTIPSFGISDVFIGQGQTAAKATAEAFAEATVDRFIVYNRNLLLETAEALLT